MQLLSKSVFRRNGVVWIRLEEMAGSGERWDVNGQFEMGISPHRAGSISLLGLSV